MFHSSTVLNFNINCNQLGLKAFVSSSYGKSLANLKGLEGLFGLPSGISRIAIENGAFIVDLPIKQ